MKFLNKIVNASDAILISLILNVNVLRFFLNIEDTNLLLYLIYGLCIVCLYKKNNKQIARIYHKDAIIRLYFLYWGVYLLYSLITCVLITGEYLIYIKFFISIIISLLCIGISVRKIIIIFKSVIIINILYVICVIINTDKVSSYMGDAVNYLNMTLTLGLCMTLSLIALVKGIYSRRYWLFFMASILVIIFFLGIMKFSARGVLIFPPIIAMYIAYLLRKNNMVKFMMLIAIFVVLIIGAIVYFLQNASEFALLHMTRLFESTEDESRLIVWTKSINEIIDNLWLFWGAGLNGFKYNLGFYPHNILLHMLADHGIIFAIGFLTIIIYVLRGYQMIVLNLASTKIGKAYLMCYASFLYYLLTFSKSFSLYDSVSLLITASLCIELYRIHHST